MRNAGVKYNLEVDLANGETEDYPASSDYDARWLDNGQLMIDVEGVTITHNANAWLTTRQVPARHAQ